MKPAAKIGMILIVIGVALWAFDVGGIYSIFLMFLGVAVWNTRRF